MEDLPHDPPSASAVPQIRSRITVVCAECKRLKLKCDRRTPCGSCTKRGTVSRCVYSSAAAEKVDLHSLNNRLMQVEAILAMVTAGQTPPPFQSTYPLAKVALPPSHPGTKLKPNYATTLSSPPSVSVLFFDLENIWLPQSQLDLYGPEDQIDPKAEISSDIARSAGVKLEPSAADALPLPPSESGQNGPLRSALSPGPVRFDLPPLHVYYSSATSRPTTAQQVRSNHYSSSQSLHVLNDMGPSYGFPPSPHTPSSLPKPEATSALFSLLPSPATRIKLLNRARIAHPHIALVAPWNRLVALADPSLKEEKGRKTALAKAVFSNGSRNVDPSRTASKDSGLPIFISLCYALALGALETVTDGSPLTDPIFLHALAGQALGVWEEFRSCDAMRSCGERKAMEGYGWEGRTKDELDHLVACLLQVKYMIRAGLSAVTGQEGGSCALEIVFPLIGKLVNLARGLGLAHDPDERVDAYVGRGVKNEERRRLIWWDIMFYDTFVSDVLGHLASVALFSYSTSLPAIAQPSTLGNFESRTSSFPTHSKRGLLDAEYHHMADGSESDDSVNKEIGRRPPRAKTPSLGPTSARKGRDNKPDDTTCGFFGVRCQLVRLVQVIKHRLSSPGCECCTCGYGSGYTFEQAVGLEGDIRTWVAELPVLLKLEPPEPKSDGSKPIKHAALAAELAIMANRLIISVYLPLMRPSFDPSTGEFSRARTYAAHPWSPASRATVDAAQCVVRAARVLHRLLVGPSNATESMTMLRDYYPLSKAVLDATVICAHAAFGTGPIKSHGPGKAILEEVTVGWEVLTAIGTSGEESGKIVGILRRKLEALGLNPRVSDGGRGLLDENMLKRKHSQVDSRADSEAIIQAVFEGPFDVENLHGSHDIDAGSLSQAMPQSHQHVLGPPTPSRGVPTPHPKTSREKEKEKKKRSAQYPSIGVRDRGKDGPSWIKYSSLHTSRSAADYIAESRMIDTAKSPLSTTFVRQTPSADLGVSLEAAASTQPPVPTRNTVPHMSQREKATNQKNADVHTRQRRRLSHDIAAVCDSTHNCSSPGYFNARGHEQGYFDQSAMSAGPGYGSTPSPYGMPSSSASSPFGSGSGPPYTPGYDSGSALDPSPPNLGSYTTDSQTYQPTRPEYLATHDNQEPEQQAIVMGGLSLDSATSSSTPGVRGRMISPSTVAPSPIYEKPQHPPYGAKPVEHQIQLHYGVAGDRSGLSNTEVQHAQHLSMDMSAPRVWTSPPHYFEQQSILGQAPQYWHTGGYYS